MFFLQFIFFLWLSLSLIKEISLLDYISKNQKKIADLFLVLYFFAVAFCLKSSFYSLFFILPCVLTLFLFLFLKRREDQNLLIQLNSLLMPLESGMKSGLSFLNAWDKTVQELSSPALKNKIKGWSQILKFQKDFRYPANKEIEQFVRELMAINQSFQPLKSLKHLQRKVRVEMAFRTKSRRALLQVRVQSLVLCLFYIGLLIGTIIIHGFQYPGLILLSLILLIIGLIWIFKMGENIKWSV